jgi:hypothetical protein
MGKKVLDWAKAQVSAVVGLLGFVAVLGGLTSAWVTSSDLLDGKVAWDVLGVTVGCLVVGHFLMTRGRGLSVTSVVLRAVAALGVVGVVAAVAAVVGVGLGLVSGLVAGSFALCVVVKAAVALVVGGTVANVALGMMR